jgi:hypothetical protein
MNERILEIARESGLLVHNPAGVPTKLEKFAELIVRECAKALDQTIAPPSHPMNSIGWKLKQHFGIEE